MKFQVTNGIHRVSHTSELNGKPHVAGVNVERGGIVEDTIDLAAKYPEKFIRVPDDTPVVSQEESLEEDNYALMTVVQLRKVADDLGIDLTGLTSKKEIVAAIQVATSE